MPRSVQCNGVADCDDGTDEYLCEGGRGVGEEGDDIAD